MPRAWTGTTGRLGAPIASSDQVALDLYDLIAADQGLLGDLLPAGTNGRQVRQTQAHLTERFGDDVDARLLWFVLVAATYTPPWTRPTWSEPGSSR